MNSSLCSSLYQSISLCYYMIFLLIPKILLKSAPFLARSHHLLLLCFLIQLIRLTNILVHIISLSIHFYNNNITFTFPSSFALYNILNLLSVLSNFKIINFTIRHLKMTPFPKYIAPIVNSILPARSKFSHSSSIVSSSFQYRYPFAVFSIYRPEYTRAS